MKLLNIKIGLLIISAFILLFNKCVCFLPQEKIHQKLTDTIVLNSANTLLLNLEYTEKRSAGYKPILKPPQSRRSFLKSDYAIRYHLKVNECPYCNTIYEQEVESKDFILENYRKYLKFELSINKLHLLVKADNKPIGIFHILPDGTPFSTTTKKGKLKKQIDDFNSNSLQYPFELVINYINAGKYKGKTETISM